jgi:hypothetical protein
VAGKWGYRRSAVADQLPSFDWADDMPAACPPSDAHTADVGAYRLVKSNPPSDEDFVRPVDKRHDPPATPEEECSLHALSVFTDVGDIELARKLIPGFKKRLVATGRIEPGDGLVREEPFTPPGAALLLRSHLDWWVPLGHDPKASFEVPTA